MRILILHQNRYYKVKYDVAIDHDAHDVCYAGTREYLDQIPKGLRHTVLLLDSEQPVKEQLRKWLPGQPRYDRVLTRQEHLLMPAAELREEFGIAGMLPHEMILFRDKVKMKDAIIQANLRAPRYQKVDRSAAALPWSGKTILKPCDGAGSQGIKLFSTAREAIAHIRETTGSEPQHIYLKNYQLEEFLEGPIWHVDGYLFDGAAVVVRTSKYVGTCLDYELGHPLGSVQFENPSLAGWALDCLRALNARNLTFHLEAIMTDEGPAFLEVAGRAGGGDIVETFERSTGVHLHVLDMASEVSGKVAKRFAEIKHTDRKYGFFIVPGHQLKGVACSVLGVDRLLQAPLVEDYRMLPEDAPTPKKATYQAHDVPLSGIVSDRQSPLLESWMQQLFARVRVVPAPILTARTPIDRACETQPAVACAT